MKKLLLVLSFIATPTLFADVVEDQVLQDLVANAEEFSLIDHEGTPLPAEFQLVNLIATHLTYGSKPATAGNIQVLGQVNVSCEEGQPTLSGARPLICQISFTDGDFEILENGQLDGPQTESSIIFEVDAVLPANGGPAIIQTRRAIVGLAG